MLCTVSESMSFLHPTILTQILQEYVNPFLEQVTKPIQRSAAIWGRQRRVARMNPFCVN